jgi:citrate lyase subunit beta/citryl-CoA lyase
VSSLEPETSRTPYDPAMRLRRSCLAVPGSSPKMLDKARTLPADQVFLDLEDAVAPSEKTDATRQHIVEALQQDWTAKTKVVRINGVATRWCWRDVTYVVEGAGAHLDCIMIPKVHDASHVHFVDHLLTQLELDLGLEVGRIGLELQIETGHGAVKMDEIASASPRAETLIFGPGDYAANLGVPQLTVGQIETDYPGDQWHYINARIVNTARAYGLQAIDGPFAAIRDLEGLREVARRSRLLGMDGKWALHPDQIAIANEVYSPAQKQFDLAVAILDAYRVATDEEGRGAVMFNGEMIDEASRKMALQVEAAGRAAGMTPTPKDG